MNNQQHVLAWSGPSEPKNPGSDSGQQRRYLSGLLPECLSRWFITGQSSLLGLYLSLNTATPLRKWIRPCFFIFSLSSRPSSWFLSFPQCEWSHPITQTFFLSTLCSSSPLSTTDDFLLATCAGYSSSTPPGTHCEEAAIALRCLYGMWEAKGVLDN